MDQINSYSNQGLHYQSELIQSMLSMQTKAVIDKPYVHWLATTDVVDNSDRPMVPLFLSSCTKLFAKPFFFPGGSQKNVAEENKESLWNKCMVMAQGT